MILSLSDRYEIFTTGWLWIEVSQNVVLSKIDITMATINKKNWNRQQPNFARLQLKIGHQELKVWCLANNLREKSKILYVWIQIKRRIFLVFLNCQETFSSQRREMLLFLTTNMAAVTSRRTSKVANVVRRMGANQNAESRLSIFMFTK